MDSPSTPLPVAYGSDTTFTETFPLHEQAERAEEAERKRQEALRYFEEVFVAPSYPVPPGAPWIEDPGMGAILSGRVTYRGAFERYQRLGVAAYDGRGR